MRVRTRSNLERAGKLNGLFVRGVVVPSSARLFNGKDCSEYRCFDCAIEKRSSDWTGNACHGLKLFCRREVGRVTPCAPVEVRPPNGCGQRTARLA